MVNLTSTQSWKRVFAKDYVVKLRYSEIEYNSYLKTGYVIHLQQACEKMFSVVENYLMVKHSRRKRGYRQLLEYINVNNVNDAELLADAFELHIFFYNGETDFDRYTIEIKYKSVLKRMKSRLKW